MALKPDRQWNGEKRIRRRKGGARQIGDGRCCQDRAVDEAQAQSIGDRQIAPQNVENALIASGYFERALVVGDRRPYVVALLVVDRERLRGETSSDAEAGEVVERVVGQVNEGLGRAEQVKRFAILPRDLSIEEGEITPTLKLRRRVCEEHFRDLIEGLYSARPSGAGTSSA